MTTYEHMGLNLILSDHDKEYSGYFKASQQHRLVIKQCTECNLMRGDPGPSCPWCQSPKWDWNQVSGKGTIYSYQIVHHSVLPGFRERVPYPIVLVELDEQSGEPTADDGIRIAANLLDNDLNPEREDNVVIGARVEVVFEDLKSGLTLPQFRLTIKS